MNVARTLHCRLPRSDFGFCHPCAWFSLSSSHCAGFPANVLSYALQGCFAADKRARKSSAATGRLEKGGHPDSLMPWNVLIGGNGFESAEPHPLTSLRLPCLSRQTPQPSECYDAMGMVGHDNKSIQLDTRKSRRRSHPFPAVPFPRGGLDRIVPSIICPNRQERPWVTNGDEIGSRLTVVVFPQVDGTPTRFLRVLHHRSPPEKCSSESPSSIGHFSRQPPGQAQGQPLHDIGQP